MVKIMRITNRLRSYILDEEFKITILNNRINIVNYNSIEHFDDFCVIVKYELGSVIIKGKNLVVSRLKSDEILISGDLNSLEFR